MDMERMKELNKMNEKFELKTAMTIEELFQLLSSTWGQELPAGPFVLKKGMMGTNIVFPTYLRIQPIISVKGTTVQCKRTEGAQMKVLGVDHKDKKQRGKKFKDAKEESGFMGGMKAAALGGPEYYLEVCNRLREILADK